MPIRDVNEVQLADIIATHLFPSKEIDSPDHLLGREPHLKRIARAFNSHGRNIFIFGDRGIGKTSVARTAAKLNNCADHQHIYVPCSTYSSFTDVMQAILNEVNKTSSRMGKKHKFGLNLGYAGASVGADLEETGTGTLARTASLAEALDVFTYVGQRRQGRTVVVIDEFDRIKGEQDKILFAELIKNLATRNVEVRLIVCGIGTSIADLLGAHNSCGRGLEPLELDKLHHNFLHDIIKKPAAKLGVEIPRETLIRIGIISDGFPHFVHLVGDCLFWAMNDDPDTVTASNRGHYEAAVRNALTRTEEFLKTAYQRATEKVKHQLEYEETLWALADRTETRRQLKAIYDTSYKRIIEQRKLDGREPMTRDQLNTRLLSLRTAPHGEIVVGHGSGFYSFRESVVRGYVRLKAEAAGIELIPDPA
jgi:Cdc6-like AAA superfamily ATPase